MYILALLGFRLQSHVACDRVSLLLYMISQVMQRWNATSTIHMLNLVSFPTGLEYAPVPPRSRTVLLFREQQLPLWHTVLGTSLMVARNLACFVSNHQLSASLFFCNRGAHTAYILRFPSDDVGQPVGPCEYEHLLRTLYHRLRSLGQKSHILQGGMLEWYPSVFVGLRWLERFVGGCCQDCFISL